MRWSTPSIQPTHNASSTASVQTTLARPVPFFQYPSQSSSAVSWFASNQSRSSVVDAKNRTSRGTSFAIRLDRPPDLGQDVAQVVADEKEQQEGQEERK